MHRTDFLKITLLSHISYVNTSMVPILCNFQVAVSWCCYKKTGQLTVATVLDPVGHCLRWRNNWICVNAEVYCCKCPAKNRARYFGFRQFSPGASSFLTTALSFCTHGHFYPCSEARQALELYQYFHETVDNSPWRNLVVRFRDVSSAITSKQPSYSLHNRICVRCPWSWSDRMSISKTSDGRWLVIYDPDISPC